MCVGGGGGSLLKVEILSVVYMYIYMCEQMDALSKDIARMYEQLLATCTCTCANKWMH